jgi:hypothetical protein
MRRAWWGVAIFVGVAALVILVRGWTGRSGDTDRPSSKAGITVPASSTLTSEQATQLLASLFRAESCGVIIPLGEQNFVVTEVAQGEISMNSVGPLLR